MSCGLISFIVILLVVAVRIAVMPHSAIGAVVLVVTERSYILGSDIVAAVIVVVMEWPNLLPAALVAVVICLFNSVDCLQTLATVYEHLQPSWGVYFRILIDYAIVLLSLQRACVPSTLRQ